MLIKSSAEMNNRDSFIHFVQGLLNLSPLERWTPNQAKHHPFITQQKLNGSWVPPMAPRSNSTRSPAPGVQQQQQAEAISKQRAQAAQAQTAAIASLQMNQYGQQPAIQSPTGFGGVYSQSQGAPPPFPSQPGYGPQVAQMPQTQTPRYNAQPSLYAQATTRAGRQRASTMEQSGIPATLQRVVSHLDPNAPIRLQPSPAYYPPPADGADVNSGSSRRRGSRAGAARRDLVRNLEDRTLEEGFMNSSNHW